MLHLPPRFARPEGAHPPLDFPDYRTTGLRRPAQPLTLIPQRLGELTGPPSSVRTGSGKVTPT